MTESSLQAQGTLAGPLIEIGIVVYPGAQLAAVYGLTDMFVIASRLAAEKAAEEGRAQTEVPRLRVSHWQLTADLRDVTCISDTHPDQPHQCGFLLLPPRLDDLPPPDSVAALAPWLKAHHAGGTVLGSICAGAFLLGATGLLQGRAATTHWSYAETLAEHFPGIIVDTDKLVIDDGDIITAGGI